MLHRLSVLSKAHQMRDVLNPTRDPAVKELVRRIRRAYAARGERPASKTALTKEPLEAMLAICTDGLVGLRDRALLTFAFSSGGRRRSEVTAAVMENLVKVDEQTYVYRLTHSKTDQAGTEHNADAGKPIVGPAAEALTVWLEASGVKSGAIFRRIRKTKAVEPLLPQAVWHIVKRRAQLAGLEGNFGAHSLRSGYVTEAGRQNVPIREAMGLTGHRSMITFMRYFQKGWFRTHRPPTCWGIQPNANCRNPTGQRASLAWPFAIPALEARKFEPICVREHGPCCAAAFFPGQVRAGQPDV